MIVQIPAGDVTERATIVEGAQRFVVTHVYHHEPMAGAATFGRAKIGQVWIKGRINKGEGTRIYDIADRVEIVV